MNFGPKCNFKRRKLQLGFFNGFPIKTKFIQDKFKTIPILDNFQTIEQCTLEYTPEKGSSIDLHIDDCWIWGERIVTVNIIGDSVLTMTPYQGPRTRYNLNFHEKISNENNYNSNSVNPNDCQINDVVVRLPMPARSLLVLYDNSRYEWEHAVLREDVKHRRVCLAYREFSTQYLPTGAFQKESQQIFENVNNFW